MGVETNTDIMNYMNQVDKLENEIKKLEESEIVRKASVLLICYILILGSVIT